MNAPTTLTPLVSHAALRELWLQQFYAHQATVTKAADTSVVAAIANATARLAQRTLQSTAVLEAQLFPERASGAVLDALAARHGLRRLGALPASTYCRLIAAPGTSYAAGTTLTGSAGQTFALAEPLVVPAAGYAYGLAVAQQPGAATNVAAGALTTVQAPPTGHRYAVNEAAATGGRDDEDDLALRQRLLALPNALARGTLAQLEQVLLYTEPNVLRLFHLGSDQLGRTVLGVATQNGAPLPSQRLQQLTTALLPFLALRDIRPDGQTGAHLVLQNISWYPVDVAARVDLAPDVNPDDVRREWQRLLQQQLDYRTWQPGVDGIEWDVLLAVTAATPGIRRVYDPAFTPRQDLVVPRTQLPRLRGCLLLTASGQLIASSDGALSPFFYPNEPDLAFRQQIGLGG